MGVLMKQLLICGAGTSGTIMVNQLSKKLNASEWQITVIDKDPSHYYQPGFLFVPFGTYKSTDIVKPKQNFLPKQCKFILQKIDRIAADQKKVILDNGQTLDYDLLIVATGSKIVPAETEGLEASWQKDAFDFYTPEGSQNLQEKLLGWQGGRFVVHLTEMPIKCPVAPLEFLFLADDWLTKNGLRERTELIYVTPLSGAFTKPIASKSLGHLLEQKGIQVIPDFDIEKVDPVTKSLVSYDEKTVSYDLLVSIPTNMGDSLIERSNLGDDLNFIPTDPQTLQSKSHSNIFVIGDATNVPASKAGSVAHFQAEILTENILAYINNKPLEAKFDGHANCFVETGNGKALLIDFNYEQEPVTGSFPLPVIGPMSLLKESRLNHWGKMAFKWIYWNILLKTRPLPITTHMSKVGKNIGK